MVESSISISTSSIANQHEQGLTTATAAASITKDNSNTNNVASCTPSNNAKPKASPKKKSKKDNTAQNTLHNIIKNTKNDLN
jgi:hypothetical protein